MFRLILLLFLTLFIYQNSDGQSNTASIMEESIELRTYPFSDPNPNPILTENTKIYPYHKYEGYTNKGEPRSWKVIQLENDYITVSVLPEVGGKIWGALDKSSGQEFIYKNDVLKFRNIAMRGPWTSGGIEFNFGIIGHHPSTATPVDYVIQEHEDGSVSCTVGNIDLPSRTQWRVQIHLPSDKAAFKTKTLWFNASPLEQSYYNWMTAAAPAKNDFQLYAPGNQYLEHNGRSNAWPVDALGRDLSKYNENQFGPSKSYHVVGALNDYFGGYYKELDYGFGHWSPYEEMPGQKLWLWALSRSGGIWEDLLTDENGQYIEFQAGRLFVQYFPGADDNPITQATFDPNGSDSWQELWFPVNGIGGISDASDLAVMYVSRNTDSVEIAINAFQKSRGTIEVLLEKEVKSIEFDIKPMEILRVNSLISTNDTFEINIESLDLNYQSHPIKSKDISRPFYGPKINNSYDRSEEYLFRKGLELSKFREFEEAKKHFLAVLDIESNHIGALVELGELHMRSGQYERGISFCQRALQYDTYHGKANYVCGILHRANGDLTNAKECLGWAARSMQYRSIAYAQMAEIYVVEKNWKKASVYADKSLDFNRYNISAWQVKVISHRKLGLPQKAILANNQLQSLDPLSHFSYYEQYLINHSATNKSNFIQSHRSEFPYQTFLELAIFYNNCNLIEESLEVLELAPDHVLIELWSAYLNNDVQSLPKITKKNPDFVFPFRRETLVVLEWANRHSEHWLFDYYYALNLWGKNRSAEALDILNDLNYKPSYAPLYFSRAKLSENDSPTKIEADLNHAQKMDPTNWRYWDASIAYYLDQGNRTKALTRAQAAAEKFPNNYSIGMQLSKAMLQNKMYEQAKALLENLQVLPFEGASEGRSLYAAATLHLAIDQMKQRRFKEALVTLDASKLWPENLGVGRPYEVDERLPNYLMAYCHENLGNTAAAMDLYEDIVAWSQRKSNGRFEQILGLYSWDKLNPSTTNYLLNTASQTMDKSVSQWVVLFYTKQHNKLGAFNEEHPDLLEDNQYLLIKRALELTDK